jgi:hypothetical protein
MHRKKETKQNDEQKHGLASSSLVTLARRGRAFGRDRGRAGCGQRLRENPGGGDQSLLSM